MSSTRSYEQSVEQFKTQRSDDQLKEERAHLQSDYDKVQERLASTDTKVRAAAVLQLADLAMRLEPGAPSVCTNKNYPYFSRAATQLALTLQQEENANVRAAILKGVGGMMEFVKARRADKPVNGADGKPLVAETEQMLADTIHEFADANRAVKAEFIKTLAHYDAVHPLGAKGEKAPANDPLALLVTLTKFTDRPEVTRICLQNLTTDADFAGERESYRQQRDNAKASEDTRREQAKADALLLDTVAQLRPVSATPAPRLCLA